MKSHGRVTIKIQATPSIPLHRSSLFRSPPAEQPFQRISETGFNGYNSIHVGRTEEEAVGRAWGGVGLQDN